MLSVPPYTSCVCPRTLPLILVSSYLHPASSLGPALSSAPEAAQKNAADGIAEGRLGLIFADLVPTDVTGLRMCASILVRTDVYPPAPFACRC